MTQCYIESGDPRFPVWLVAEAPGADEIAAGRPLVGQSGQELDRMLLEAGWPRPEALYRTNVCHERPPSYTRNGKVIHNDINQFFASSATAARREGLSPYRGRYPREPVRSGLARLEQQLAERRPRLIIALGGTALWGLCGRDGITKWRGSVLGVDSAPAVEPGLPFYGTDAAATRPLTTKLIPTFHPEDILRQWTHRPIAVQDLRRALRESEYDGIERPSWQFVVAPSVADVRDWLCPIIEDRKPLTCDTEGWGVTDCIGFADTTLNAICIPLVHETGSSVNYWSQSDEFLILQLVLEALRVCPITFHNGLWDCQVLAHEYGIMPNFTDDTMLMQHVAFPGLLGGRIDPVTGKVDKKGSSLSLSFIASMYCHHYAFWKDDGRQFDPAVGDERDYWRYNCEDCVRTHECADVLRSVLAQSQLTAQYRSYMDLFAPVFKMMFRGLRVDRTAAREMRTALNLTLANERQWLRDALGFDLNVGSTTQMRALFHDDLKLPATKNRKTGAPTLDDTALETIARKQPTLLPLVRKIQNIRTLQTFGARGDTGNTEKGLMSVFEDAGDRLRTALNVGFVETFRFSSNQTAFREGGNLQNIPRPPED